MARLLKVVLLLVAASSVASADFFYSFQSAESVGQYFFTFTSPGGPVTALLNLRTSDLDHFTGLLDDNFGAVLFDPTFEPTADFLVLKTDTFLQLLFRFDGGAFSTPGIHEALPGINLNPGVLSVREITPASVPEPFSVVLLGTVAGFILMKRRVREKLRRGA